MRWLIGLAFLSGVFQPADAGPPPMKVMTFNVRFDEAAGEASSEQNAWVAASGVNRRDLALRIIRSYEPDILAVQETLKNQVNDIQREFSSHECYGIGRDDGAEQGEYCAIFYRKTRFVRIKQGTFWLNERPQQVGSKFPGTCCARIASWVVLKDTCADSQEFLVLNSHWDHQVQEARFFSARLIRQRLPEIANGRPILVLGDFNAAPQNAAYRCLVGAETPGPFQLQDSYRDINRPQKHEGTFHAFQGSKDGLRIDHILHGSEFETLAAEIVRTHFNQRYASDHFPVTATLVLTEEQ